MKTQFRSAVPADLATVARILNDSNPMHSKIDTLGLLERSAHSVLIVAEDTSGIVGTITIAGPGTPEAQIAGDDGAFIHGAAVDPTARKQGIFNDMVRTTIKALRRQGFGHVTFQALPEAAVTRRLALRLGARKVPSEQGMAQIYVLNITPREN